MKHPSKMNFLIVDDMDNMRRSIRAMLRLINFGKEYFEAPDGMEAWKILSKEKYPIDFIISDFRMPRMSGTELLNKIRSSPKFREIPFLMITAEANMEIVAEAAENEVDGYMTKPFVTATMEQKILELIHQMEHPDPFTALLRKIRDLKDLGNIDEAIELAQTAIATNRQSSRPFRELGLLYHIKNDLKKAIACFEKATEINRLDVVSYHHLGEIYFQYGNIDKAIDNYAKAMHISPRHAERALNFGLLLLNKNKLKEAEKVLKIILRQSLETEMLEKIADGCLQHGLPELAIKVYQDILKKDPERTYLNAGLGIALFRNGDSGEAIKILQIAAAQAPGKNIDVVLTLAEAFLAAGKTISADLWANQALKIEPDNERAREILRQCY